MSLGDAQVGQHAVHRKEAQGAKERKELAGVSLQGAKYWPPVARVDNVYGDRNLFCSCIPMEEYAKVSSDGAGAAEAPVRIATSA